MDEPWRQDMSDARAKLVSVVKTRGGGKAESPQQARDWRSRRRIEVAEGMTGGKKHDTTVPCFGMDTFKEKEKVEMADTPSAVQRLTHRPLNVLPLWRTDPIHVLGREQKLDNDTRTKLAKHGKSGFIQTEVLAEHSRNEFATANDRYRFVGELRLKERLFLFYQRRCKEMVKECAAVAEYWEGTAEDKLDEILAFKYGGHNLQTEGLGRSVTETIDMRRLVKDMAKHNIKMSDGFMPLEHWIPQHESRVAPIALRDALLLSEAQISRPHTAWDVSVQAQFVKADALAPRTFPPPAIAVKLKAEDEDEAPKDVEMWRVSLSLKEQVVGMVRPVTSDASLSSPASIRPLSSTTGSLPPLLRPLTVDSDLMSTRTTPLHSAPSTRAATPANSILVGGQQHNLAAVAPPQTPPAGRERPETGDGVRGRDGGWRMQLSETYSEVFWYNAATGESRWTKPKASAQNEQVAAVQEEVEDDDAIDVRQAISKGNISKTSTGAGGAMRANSIERMSSMRGGSVHSTRTASSTLGGAWEEEEEEEEEEKGRSGGAMAEGDIPEEEVVEDESNEVAFNAVKYHGEYKAAHMRMEEEGKGAISTSTLIRLLRQRGITMTDSKRMIELAMAEDDESLTWHGLAIILTLLERHAKGVPVPFELPESLINPPAKASGVGNPSGMKVERKRNLGSTRHWAFGHDDGGAKRVKSKPMSLHEAAASRIQAFAKGFGVRYFSKHKSLTLKRILRSVRAAHIQIWWRKMLKKLKTTVARGSGDAFDPMPFRVMFRIRVFCRGWVSRARGRIRKEEMGKAARIIQRKYRGMIGMRKLRRMRLAMLEKACVVVQRAWRKRLAWIKIVRKEEARVSREAKKLAKAYLFGGFSAKEAAGQKKKSLADFENNTSELGRNRKRQSLHANASGREDVAPAFRKSGDSVKASWLVTLKMMQKKEAEEEEQAAVVRGGGGGGASTCAGGGDGGEGKPKQMASLFGFTDLKNSDEVEASIGEQRAGAAKQLSLINMHLKRWPFGVTDKNTGRPLWLWLQTVWLSNNNLQGLPMDFYMLTCLTDLRLDGNHLKGVPPQIGNLTRLQTLWLHQNQVSHVPPEMWHLQEMTHVTLHTNQLVSLPFDWYKLSSLKQMALHSNPLRSPPMALALMAMKPEGVARVLTYLLRFYESLNDPHVLFLEGFKLQVIPPDFTRIGGCKDLVLRKNRLKFLDEETFWDSKFKMQFHPYLTRLDVSNNKIAELPDVITKLISLNSINISENLVSRLPLSLVNLTSLTDLKAKGNPLTFPPMEVVDHGVEVYLLGGSKLHASSRMGMYFKTTDVHCGRAVFRKKDQEGDDVDALTAYTPTASLPRSRRSSAAFSRRQSVDIANGSSRPSTASGGARSRPGSARNVLSRPGSGKTTSHPGSGVSRGGVGEADNVSMPGSGRSLLRPGSAVPQTQPRPGSGSVTGGDGKMRTPSRLGSADPNASSAHRRGSTVAFSEVIGFASVEKPTSGSASSQGGSRPATASSLGASTMRMSDLERDSVSDFQRGLERHLGKATEKRERPALYFSSECSPPSWCLGPDTDPQNCWLRAMDTCVVPSEISAEWIEMCPNGNLPIRGETVFLQGVGVFEFCWRGLRYANLKSRLKKMKKDFKANEDIWRRQGDMKKLIEVQKANKIVFEDEAKNLQQQFQNMALKVLPKDCVDMNAQTMLLSNNLMRRYPDELCGMERLRDLNIENNLLRSLPASIKRLTSLTSLNLSCNDITVLPITISMIESLKLLELSRNRLAVAPSVEMLTSLEVLSLDHNQVACIPLGFSCLVRLSHFKLGFNVLKTLDAEGHSTLGCFQGLRALKALDVNSNHLKNLSPSVKALGHMERLDISRNFFESLDSIRASCIHWKSLTTIKASQCSITVLPEEVADIKTLTSVDISANSLSHVPSCLFSLPVLRAINLNVNFVKVIPPEICGITALTDLSVNNNIVVVLPAEMRFLTLLKKLDLSHNSIRSLPPFHGMCLEVIGKLANLEVIDFSNNFLKTLPFDIPRLTKIKEFKIESNPFKAPLILSALRPCLGSLSIYINAGEHMPAVNHQGKAGQKGSRHVCNPFIESTLHHVRVEGRPPVIEETQRTSTKQDTADPIWREHLVHKMLDYKDFVNINLRHGLPMLATEEEKDIGEPLLGTLQIPVLTTIIVQDTFWSCLGLNTVGKLSKCVKCLRVFKDEVITKEGDVDGTYFFLMSGEVEIRKTDGKESRPVGTLPILTGTGGYSFLLNAPQVYTLVALSDSVLFTMKADETPKDGDYEQEYTERHDPDCLSAALCGDGEGLVKQVIFCEFNRRGPDDGEMHVAWGSQAWSKARLEEHATLRRILRKVQQTHAMTEREFHDADMELEKINRRQRDLGESLLLCAMRRPIMKFSLTFTEEALRNAKRNVSPQIELQFLVKPLDSVDSILSAIARSSYAAEVKGPEMNAAELLKKRESKFITPPGVDFEVETDPVMYDKEVERMTRFDRDIIDQRAKGRVKELWEAMPRFLAGAGAAERPWDTAFRGKDDYMSGEFWGMAALTEYAQSVPGAAEIKLRRRTGLNKELLKEVGDEVEQNKPKHEWEERVKTRAMIVKERLARWDWVVGLLLLKPQYLNNREAKNDAMKWQDRQLKALRDVQEEVNHKDRMAVIKQEIAEIEREMMKSKINVKEAVESLRGGWHLEGVVKYKSNKARVEELKPKLGMLLQSKLQQKTFYKLGMSLSKSMEWKKQGALTHLFNIFEEQADEILEPVASLANILGGNIEPDLLDDIRAVEAVAPGAGMDHVMVCDWLLSDPVLSRVPDRRARMVEMVSKHQIGGRTLFNCSKVDLQRMGLPGPSARLLLSRVFALMQETGSTMKRALTNVESIAAQYASMPDKKERDKFLMDQLFLGEEVLEEMRVIFVQYDPNNNEEIPCKFIGKILADQGDFVHPNELKRLSKLADPEESGASDFVGFCAAMKETSFVVGTAAPPAAGA